MSGDGPQSRRRRLNDIERALWRGVTRSVAPLKRRRIEADDDAVASAEPKAKVATAAKTARPPAPPPRASPKPSVPPLVGLDRRSKQRLVRGSEPIDARIDLHGRTQGEAYAALLRFMTRAQAKGARTVLVITGKGARGDHASGRGVLKRQVPLWLALPEFRGYVLGVDDAHVTHGGAGALYVRLRRAR